MTHNPKLRIMSLNCRKQPEVYHTMINTTNPNEWDIICLQEPPYHIDSRRGYHTTAWNPIYPSIANNRNSTDNIRSIILVNSRIPSDSYTQPPIPSLDITAITTNTPKGPTLIISVYNPPDSNTTITALSSFLSSTTDPDTQIIAIGDFNKHDALWAGPTNPARNRRSDSEPLLIMMAEHHLRSSLPAGTPTFHSEAHDTWTTVDLALVSDAMADDIDKCDTGDSYTSDHLSLLLILDITTPQRQQTPRPRHRDVDWGKYQTDITEHLTAHPLPTNMVTPNDIDYAVHQLTSSIQTTLSKLTPKSNTTKYSKPWWTSELSRRVREVK
jgi:hypothetical protein